MPRAIKKNKKNKFQNVDYSMPYEGAEGRSVNSEVAKKMWANKASSDEQRLGYVLTKDTNGNFITRTKLQSKA